MSALFAGLFNGIGPRVRAIPASVSFLDVFVDAMIAELYRPEAPFALADALILLPNRRAAQGLIETFARKLGGAALLPTIRPLADLDDDADVWGPDPIDFDIAPEIPAARRRLELAQLVRAKLAAEGMPDDPVRALALADELARLLDSAAAADAVDWGKTRSLVEDIDLAAHWRKAADFLDIVAAYWPQRLAADGLADPAARRGAVLDALGAHWAATQPTHPIVIAGSTGSISATRRLMAVVAHLPRGAVVLPGLDRDLDDAAWDAIEPQHPQAALRDTLAALDLRRADVALLGEESATGRARRVLMREALAPADTTADWLTRLEDAGGAKLAADALEGLSLIETENEEKEAATIALMMREAMETPGRSVALVAPDSKLARRVAAKLARWDIAPAVSQGMPLRETACGVLLALLCDLARDTGEPVALAGLLSHPLAHFCLDAATFATQRGALMRGGRDHPDLRGARRHETLADLAAICPPAGRALVARVEDALAPFAALGSETTLAEFAEALAASVEAIAGEAAWAGRAGERAASLVRSAAEEGAALGATDAYGAARAFMRLLDGVEAAPESGGDPRCAIWGPLEARLQRRDLLILSGLNEGVWPAPAAEDPFLSRAMRAALGLPSPETRIGLAAHDFAQLACAPSVVMTRALKREGAPSVASRWIWRLDTLLRGAGLDLRKAAPAKAWAQVLDEAAHEPVAPPRPRPPHDGRLTRISVTEVETLIRDPYAVYARRLLGFEPLKPIGHRPSHAERGTAVHRAIELSGVHEDFAALMRGLDQALKEAGFDRARRAAEQARLAASARAFLAWAAAREGEILREQRGVLDLREGRQLSGVADRIEIQAGGAVIVDYKTGAPPSDQQVTSGLSPQLPLEAAMLARGAFPGVRATPTRELIYWRFGGAKPEWRGLFLAQGAAQAGEAALARLEELLAIYAAETQPFLSKPRVKLIKPYADFDHLARRKEWAEADNDDRP